MTSTPPSSKPLSKLSRPSPSPIAVVGVSTLFPGSLDATGYWRDILAGTDRITDVPPGHWLIEDYYDPDPKAPDKTYARRGAFLPEVAFDPMAWGIPPSTVPATDTCQLLALIVAQRVLEDASRGQFKYEDRDRMSVILGVTSAQELLGSMNSRLQRPVWTKALRDMGLPEDEVQEACARIESHYCEWQEATFPGVLGNVVAGRIANKLDLGGTNCVTDAACASTFSALAMGVGELHAGSSDVVICGGADTMNDIFMYLCFSKTPALSKSGDCRPFSDQADGTMLGEGIGMVALKRLEDAERDGDRVYAIIRGVGTSSDGGGTAVYAPKPSGQAKALRRAYESAGYDPSTVELVEAHGTGTIAGDAAELEGLRTVFLEAPRAQEGERQWCALGSVKGQIGHCKAAAGAAGLVKAVLALHQKSLPPTIKVERPSPVLDLEKSPFYLSTRARPWIRDDAHPRRASVSSFGFGGSNFHIALEEYTGPAAPALKRRAHLAEVVVLSAESADALASDARALAAELRQAPADTDALFAFVAQDTQRRYRADAPHRLAIVAERGDELAIKLDKAAAKITGAPFETPDGICYGVGPAEGDVAFLFPGQGSQYRDMGAAIAMTWDEAREPWDAAASMRFDAVPLHEVVFPRPVFDSEVEAAQEARLRATEWAQPSIGVASLSLLALTKKIGLTPVAVGGHSFGEITALHAAGVLDREAMIRVARRRGELMAEAAKTPGAMTAVSAPADEVRAHLAQWSSDGSPEATLAAKVVLANHNGPKQIVLSGPTDAIEAVEAKLASVKLRATRLPVATAFHSSVVSASTEPFAQFLSDVPVGAAQIPVYGNTHAAPYPSGPGEVRAIVAQQIAEPVRFVEMIEAMYARGVRTFVEVGPGAVLSGLVGRILAGRAHRAVALDQKSRDGVTSLMHGLARLAAAGAAMNLAALSEGFEVADDPRTRKKPRLTLKLTGANYGKPYPPPDGAAGLPKPNPKRAPTAPAPAHASAASTSTATPATSTSAPSAASTSPASTTASPAATTRAPTLTTPASASPAPRAPAALTPPTSAPIATTPPMSQRNAPPPAHAQPTHAQPTHLGAPTHAHPPHPTAPTPAPMSAPTVVPASGGWPAAYLEVQRQAMEAHAAYTRAMADAHAAFLGTQQAALVTLPALVAGDARFAHAQPYAQAPTQAPAHAQPYAPAPAYAQQYAPAPAPAAPAPTHAAAPAAAPVAVAAPVPAPAAVAVPAPVPAPAAAAPAAPRVDLKALMLDIVADKTGYPVDMLELSMDLEADLGVDSIKRVEILAAMRERAPGLPEVDPAELGKLRTLQEIVDRMDAALPTAPSVAAVGVGGAPTQSSVAPSVAAAPRVDLKALMLDIVADKTGYPVDMLELSMDLEADLGVDSIKRVEILAAMRERAPGLPEVDPAELGKLRTLQEIVDRMDAALPTAPSVAAVGVGVGGAAAQSSVASSQSSAAPSVAAAPRVDLKALMLDIVADKTGYPADMLELSMDLEADLGVDSIKRVEILAAMRERAPGLPEVDPAELGKLRTLQEIVDRMDVALPSAGSAVAGAAEASASTPGASVAAGTSASTPGAPVAAAAGAPDAATRVDLKALMLDIVADKTGYPADMLELSMDLEADLGVDSIKRVEILAAMRERAPGLPEVDPAELGKLRTLQEIVDRMDVALPAGHGAAADHDASTSAPPSSDARRFALKLADAPATGFALAGLLDLRDPARPLVLVEDGRGVAPRLAERLRAAGLAVEVALVVPAHAGGVVFLEGLSEVPTIDDALAVQRRAFLAAKAVAPRFAEEGGVFVTVQDTGGDFGLGGAGDRAWLGGLPGLVKTAAQEWPKAALRAIDLERADRDADALAAQLERELLHGGPGVSLGGAGETLSGGGLEVALDAAGHRRTLVSFAADILPSDSTARVDASSVFLASGGARGVTAATLIRLAQATQCKLVLLGRTALRDEPAACAGAQTDAELKRVLLAAAQAEGRKVSPADLGREVAGILSAREVRQTLAAIETAGGQARYVAADVADQDALRAALAPIRREWGPVTGVVHGAGLLADRFIADKTPEQFDRVFDTKVRGLVSLLEATREDAPTVLLAFSSVAGRCGNRGQCDYAMANETLSKVVAAEARARGLFGRSLGWGPWEGGMVTPALRAHFERLGVPLLPLDIGAQMLVDELAGAAPSFAGAPDISVELVLGGEPRPEPLAGDAGPRRDFRYELTLDRVSFPAIDHHRVKGEPVVPVALVLELFARAVRASRPDLVFARCEEVKVFRGIPLAHFDAAGDRFAVTLDQRSNGDGIVFVASLLDHDGKRRYGAVVHALRAHPAPSPMLPIPEGLAPFTGVVYDGVALFHGDAFQVISGAPSMSEHGLTATLHGGSAKGWSGPYALDPALLDGGLQLALLWTTGGTGAAALPTAIGALHILRPGLIEGDVRVILRGRERRSDKGVSDLVFLDEAGDVIAELRGVEMHVLPGTASSAHV